MRLWHKDLIDVLPRQQLLGQWRECCAIAKSLKEKGTPNHILVNLITEYPLDHFVWYQFLVWKEMKMRGYSPDDEKFYKWIPDEKFVCIEDDELFKDWHNTRYLRQCLMNLEEKYDRGGIPEEEWKKIQEKFPYMK